MKYKAIAAGMLAASLLAYPVSSLAETKKFSDVRDDSFAKDAIYYLVDRDVISGMTSDTFAPKVVVIEEKDSWIRIRTNSGFQWVDTNQLNPVKQENFLEGKAIIIDPGHGGIDSGNVGYYEEESKIVLDTSLRLQKIFEKKTTFTVKLTRTNDTRPGVDSGDSLRKRVEFANENKGDMFVSIHGNGSTGKDGHGTETFYYAAAPTKSTNPYTEDSRLLADKIQKRLVAALGTYDRGVKKDIWYVVKYNTMPAVLTELAFVDNKSDADKIATPKQR
ncbi:S-layer protein [Bacillus wiedmannii]|uniref:S-layer protein n=1 Tax=Bacillus wiedmannii TaxID=1890302 RepID=A0A0G8CNT1_9BACI|nr:S-layer protein [Bacillus wiedmannii]